jgi:hypothetical protein
MRQRLHIVDQPVKRTRAFSRIEDAIAAMCAGQMVIVVDDEKRENEGDLTIAAEKITPQAINFMAQYGRGLICLAMTPERLDALEIPLMVSQNSSRFDTAFCVNFRRGSRGHSPRGDQSSNKAGGSDPSWARVPVACKECWYVPGKQRRRWTWRG